MPPGVKDNVMPNIILLIIILIMLFWTLEQVDFNEFENIS